MNKNIKTIKSLPLSGISDVCKMGNGFVFGSKENGNIYKFDGTNIQLLCQTGEEFGINSILNIDDINILASIRGKLFLILGNESLSSFSNSTSVANSIILADLGEDENITDIIKLNDSKSIVFSTTSGRILSCSTDIIRGYLTGERTIYADVQDGFGISSNASSNVTYALYNKIAEITEQKEIVKWKFVESSAINYNRNTSAVFISPIMYVKEDFGFWKEIAWEEIKPQNTEIIISIKTSEDSVGLLNGGWKYSFKSNVGEVGTIIRSLNDVSLNGQYSQIKVEMTTLENNILPIVSNISLKYSTKQASYFFTTKFSLEQNSNNSGLLVAKITEPQNTEVKFGICDSQSTDWKDYTVIDPETIFNIQNKNMKVGIKFISYNENIPEVAEFAILMGSDNKKNLNG